MFDLITVGHFAIDLIHSPNTSTPKPTLGGASAYVSLAARKLGAQVSVISTVGDDFSNEYLALLNANAVDLSGLKKVKEASTTRFILRYENWKRKLQLESRAPPILLKDIPNFPAEAIHVAPIANEISCEVIERLRAQARILSLDPQGFLRRFDKRGNTSLSRWQDSTILRQIDLYKSSLDEIKVVTGFSNSYSAMRKIYGHGTKIVIVTRGMKGSTLLFEDRFCNLPACRPRTIKDPTGAGDAFIGAFLAEYTKGKEPLWCACVGSAASSFVIEGVGPAVFGEKRETYARAAGIYEKVAFQNK